MAKLETLLVTLGCVMLPVTTLADQPDTSPVTISLSTSTLGAGVGAGWRRPGGLLGVRGSLNLFHFDINFDESGSKARAQATLQNETLLVDLYPTRQHFRVTAGLIFNQNSANVSTSPQITGTLLSFITHTHYHGVIGDVAGPISFNPVDPYFGIGYDFTVGNHWTVKLDTGAMYQGNGRIALTPSGLLAANPQMRAAVTASAKKADSWINKMSFYPVIGLQICYHF